jgi:hypothetical protein
MTLFYGRLKMRPDQLTRRIPDVMLAALYSFLSALCVLA